MTKETSNPAFEEKNAQDFIEVTKKLQSALARIESDSRLKPTQAVLSKLAECSRGTINNRKWPLEKLKKIKAARKASIKPEDIASKAIRKEESRIERYKEQLFNNREELLVWKMRHDEQAQRVVQLEEINRVLQQRIKRLEDELTKTIQRNSTGIVTNLKSKFPS
jgi:hypothetical protein